MSSECQYAGEAAAYVSHELSANERTAFDLHLSTCPECRAAVESSRLLIGRLKAVPAIAVSRDLAPLILEKLCEPERELPRTTWWQRYGAIAATITLLTGGLTFWGFKTATSPAAPIVTHVDENSSSVDRALDWLCEHQEPDGSWNAAKWGGNRRFEIALTALPVIALLDDPALDPNRAAAVSRAVTFVRSRQNPDGTFGKPFQEAPYVQSITTLALLRAYQRQPEPALRRSLDAALDVILASQTTDGGWGYRHSPMPNLPVTLWHKDVVELAIALGWKKAEPSLERVTRWLASQPSQKALTANTASSVGTDYHSAYFTAISLRQKDTAEAHQQLAAIQRSLIASQAGEGEESGSWSPTDQWGRAGGRIYSTALASMALR